MLDIDLFAATIYAVTHFPEKLIRQTIEMADHGIEPIKMRGTMQYDVWMHYKILREYERRRIHEPRESG